ncbi:MAG: hypothetical protein R3C53_03515 [Pirellulaceae bacterium]
MNPFSYGGIVGNSAFCNRLRELRDLTETMKSAGRCFVYAERRMGKTSLILRALAKLPKRQFIPVYVDLWPTDGSAAFSEATGRGALRTSIVPGTTGAERRRIQNDRFVNLLKKVAAAGGMVEVDVETVSATNSKHTDTGPYWSQTGMPEAQSWCEKYC